MKNDDQAEDSANINDGSDLIYNKTDILNEEEYEEHPLPEPGPIKETKLSDIPKVQNLYEKHNTHFRGKYQKPLSEAAKDLKEASPMSEAGDADDEADEGGDGSKTPSTENEEVEIT